ncbi:MAG: hypothetical protein ACQEQU_01705 [Spirochaetota bacterium]
MKWYAYVIMILLWAVAIIVQISWSWWYLLVLLLAVNVLEYLFVGLWVGKKTGTNPWGNFLMCLVFGFVWWLPLRRAVRDVKRERKATASAEKVKAAQEKAQRKSQGGSSKQTDSGEGRE